MSSNGKNGHSEDEDLAPGEDVDPSEYDQMLELERLESLEEDMVDLGLTSLDQVRQRIAQLHAEMDHEDDK